MNIAVTTAAEGFPRRAFKVSDVRRMIDAGVLREDEKFELIGGDFVMMAAGGYAHELIKNAICSWQSHARSAGLHSHRGGLTPARRRCPGDT